MTLHQAELAVETVRPEDDDYDAAARVFFADGAPAVIARPREPDEVAAALAYAGAHDLPLAVRAGGHSALGHGTNTGGMVIDLARMNAVEVLDARRRLVRVGGGAKWGAVAAALDRHGWALTSGDTADVGVGGLTLGGGIGWLVRKHGLAIDNLIGARVVTADGHLVTASAHENPELFWALRGGGGNFGVVVDFDFVAQALAAVHFGVIEYRMDEPAALVGRWRDAMRSAPDEVSSTLVLMPNRLGQRPVARVLLCYAGDGSLPEAEVDRIIEPLLSLGSVVRAEIAERRYAEILEDAAMPPGLRLVSRNALVPCLDDAVIDAVASLPASPAPTAVAIRSLGGAFGRMPVSATAFAHRDAEAMIVAGLMLPDGTTDAEVEVALAPWRGVAALGTGTYVNFQGSATAADVAAAYPPATYARLAAVKRAYDPENRFALNHNVRPA